MTCPNVQSSSHGLLVCTRDQGHHPPCHWKRKNAGVPCPECGGACRMDPPPKRSGRMSDEEFERLAGVQFDVTAEAAKSMGRAAYLEARRARAEEARLREENARLMAERDDARAQLDDEYRVTKALETKARERIDAERARAEMAEAERDTTADALVETEAELARIREELESVAANRAELVGVVTETVAERDAERARAEKAEAEVARLREVVTETVTELAKLREEMRKTEAENSKLQEELEEVTSDRDDWNMLYDARLRDLSAERALVEIAEATRDGLAEENGRLRAALAGFVRKADSEEEHRQRMPDAIFHSRWWPQDHACAECVPGGEIVVKGFRCALHEAKALLGQAPLRIVEQTRDGLREENARLLEQTALMRPALDDAAERLEELHQEIERLRTALKPFAERAESLVGYRGEQPDRLVQMGITAADCQHAAEVLK